MLACHQNGWVPVFCWLVKKKDEYRSYAVLSKKMDAVLSDAILS